jgi:hypothetical protein
MTVQRCDHGADFAEFVALWQQVHPRDPAPGADFAAGDPAEPFAGDNASLIQALWAAMPFGLAAEPEDAA